MSDLTRLSPGARALFDAAKSDGPSSAARTSMWGAVSTTTGAAATAATAASAATSPSIAVAAASSGKLLVVGALFGSALTLGVALAVVRVAPSVVVPHRGLPRETVEVASYAGAGERASEEAQPIPLVIDAPSSPGRSVVALPREGARAHVALEDPLMREAGLVAKARGALVRSDPEAALASLDAARRVGSRGLEPEELSLRARALRLLDREEEASAIEGKLRSRYPDHFLSR